jgi:hypothetical protein
MEGSCSPEKKAAENGACAEAAADPKTAEAMRIAAEAKAAADKEVK